MSSRTVPQASLGRAAHRLRRAIMSDERTMAIEVDTLTAAIDAVTSRIAGRDLARAADALSARYRDTDGGEVSGAPPTHAASSDGAPTAGAPSHRAPSDRAVTDREPMVRALTDAERAAYLAVRAPATFAAVSAVLDELLDRCPNLDVRSVLDLGAGPGVGTWAALARFPHASRLTLVERDGGFVAIGREILDASGLAAGRSIDYRPSDLRPSPPHSSNPHSSNPRTSNPRTSNPRTSNPLTSNPLTSNPPTSALPPSDLVLLSYALAELPPADRPSVIDAAWHAARGALVIVEPGTPRHFAVVLEARTRLVSHGATIAAPCPHASACPMAAASDWCHVSVRLSRSKQHRRLKAGSLSYEDEKFSYLVATRVETHTAESRIVRHPIFEKGRVTLTRCMADGLEVDTIGRTSREAYRHARKARWGDAWPPPPAAAEDDDDDDA